MQITLPDERPISWNRFYAGVHWTVRKREADRVHWMVRAAIDPEVEPFDEPVHITVTAYFDSRPLDASNICAKIFEDALVGWLIHDDGPDYVHSVTTRSRVDPDAPRVVIDLEVASD